ncbi:MAG: hypothetical protein HQK75_04555 [Candidatus Magnetomorum sp.]|nr:hypothetical protein [Candidatus Magnetomorum sp.]
MNNNDTEHFPHTFLGETLAFRKYFFSFFCLNSITVCVMLLCFILLFYFKIGPYHELYLYQTKKLNDQSNIDTIFIGDSSLGNAINANLFNSKTGLKSVNLALTGMYGYAGSYNMLKKAVRKNRIKNVIMIQTIETLTRSVSYDGYLYSMDSLSDFTELQGNEITSLLEASINILFSFNNLKRVIFFYFNNSINTYTIEKDYIKQTIPIKQNINTPKIRIKVDNDKPSFLKKIVDYCNQNHINLIYLHGPYLGKIDEQSKTDINALNSFIKLTGAKLVETIPFLTTEQVGDQRDHVHPSYKDMITLFYCKTIKEQLLTGGD